MASFLFPPLPHDASAHGHDVDAILRFLLIGTGSCFAIMAAILLVSVVFHRGRGRTARYTHGNRRRDRMAAALAGAVVLFGIDAVAVVRSAGALRRGFWDFPDADPRALRVEVTAQQWAWTFRYPGPDGVFATADDIVTLNELRVPVDRPVTLQLTSKDVVHAMYLPNFRTKVDAIPGTVTRLWFEPREAGAFEIGCAQHCGAWHYKMRGELTVMAAEGFGRWLERAGADAALRATAASVVGAATGTATTATATATAAAGADIHASLGGGWTWNGPR
jgi:cytochrome c oxidase subunit 2